MDVLGKILWYTIPLTPFITIPLVWKNSDLKKVYRVLIGLALAICISAFLYFLSMQIAFRDGMGP